ncbi:MAG: carbohydrate-binding protein [Deltaproteobacteria bacterium]|nr:carbohydrate-binding protein [Deltaproteobacteria bacterium]
MLGQIAYATALASVSPFDCGLASNEAGVVPEITSPVAPASDSPPAELVAVKPKSHGILINPGALLEQSGLNRFGNDCCIGNVDGGDWGRHPDVDFGTECSFDKVILYYATPNAGGKVRFRIGNAEGPVIGEVSLVATGADFSSGGMVTMELEPVRGKHPLIVQFVGGFGIGNFTGYSFQSSGNRKTCPKSFDLK